MPRTPRRPDRRSGAPAMRDIPEEDTTTKIIRGIVTAFLGGCVTMALFVILLFILAFIS